MSDNKLRCALVFRLDGSKSSTSDSGDGIAMTNISSGPVTMLAKYDHAHEYEAHAGSKGGLYGDKEKNYADAVGLVVGNDPPAGVADEGVIGGFKVVQSDLHQVVYGADSDGLCECTTWIDIVFIVYEIDLLCSFMLLFIEDILT